jgi:hypothetical protein
MTPDRIDARLGECPIPDCPGEIYAEGDLFKCTGRGHIFSRATNIDPSALTTPVIEAKALKISTWERGE